MRPCAAPVVLVAVAACVAADPPLARAPIPTGSRGRGGGSTSGSPPRSSSVGSSSGVSSATSARQPAWELLPSPVAADLHGVAAAEDGTAWAVGAGGTILRYERGYWQAVTSPTTATLWGVTVADADTAFAVGNGGTALRFNGVAWLEVPTGVTAPLNAVEATAAHDAYAVGGRAGQAGVILRFDGSGWVDETPAGTSALFGVARVARSGVDVAVGERGTVLVRAVGPWSPAPVPAGGTLVRVVSAPESARAVGVDGRVLAFDGTAFSLLASVPVSLLGGAWSTAQARFYLVGGDGIVFREEAGFLLREPVITARTLWAAAATPDALLVVGDQGTLLRFQ